MKEKKISYKDLCELVIKQNEQIAELKQTINYIQNNYSCDIPFQVETVYSYPSTGEELHISYLKNGKVNTIIYTLNGCFSLLPKIKEIIKQNENYYIITLQRTKDYYEYYAVDTFYWTISDITSLIKSNDIMMGIIKKSY